MQIRNRIQADHAFLQDIIQKMEKDVLSPDDLALTGVVLEAVKKNNLRKLMILSACLEDLLACKVMPDKYISLADGYLYRAQTYQCLLQPLPVSSFIHFAVKQTRKLAEIPQSVVLIETDNGAPVMQFSLEHADEYLKGEFSTTVKRGYACFAESLAVAIYAIKAYNDSAFSDEKTQPLAVAMRSAYFARLLGRTGFAFVFQNKKYLVTDWCQGRSLNEMSSDAVKAIPIEKRVKHLLNLVRQLAILHRLGLIHGDIKPENIMLPDDPDGVAMLIDLDSVRIPDELRKVSEICTPAFLEDHVLLKLLSNQSISECYDMKSDLHAFALSMAYLFPDLAIPRDVEESVTTHDGDDTVKFTREKIRLSVGKEYAKHQILADTIFSLVVSRDKLPESAVFLLNKLRAIGATDYSLTMTGEPDFPADITSDGVKLALRAIAAEVYEFEHRSRAYAALHRQFQVNIRLPAYCLATHEIVHATKVNILASLADAELFKCIQRLLMRNSSAFLDNHLAVFWEKLGDRVHKINWLHDDLAALMRLANFKRCEQFVSCMMVTFFPRIKKSSMAIANVFGAIDMKDRADVYSRCIAANPVSSIDVILSFLSLLPLDINNDFLFHHINYVKQYIHDKVLVMKWLERDDVTVTEACKSPMVSYVAKMPEMYRKHVVALIESKLESAKDIERIGRFYLDVLSDMNEKNSDEFAIKCLCKQMSSAFNNSDEALAAWWQKAVSIIQRQRNDHELLFALMSCANNTVVISPDNRERFYRALQVSQYVSSDNIERCILLIPVDYRMKFVLDHVNIIDQIKLLRISYLLKEREYKFLAARRDLLGVLDAYLADSTQSYHDHITLLRANICDVRNAVELEGLVRSCRHRPAQQGQLPAADDSCKSHPSHQVFGLFVTPAYLSVIAGCKRIVQQLLTELMDLPPSSRNTL